MYTSRYIYLVMKFYFIPLDFGSEIQKYLLKHCQRNCALMEARLELEQPSDGSSIACQWLDRKSKQTQICLVCVHCGYNVICALCTGRDYERDCGTTHNFWEHSAIASLSASEDYSDNIKWIQQIRHCFFFRVGWMDAREFLLDNIARACYYYYTM